MAQAATPTAAPAPRMPVLLTQASSERPLPHRCSPPLPPPARTMTLETLRASDPLRDVRYEIRGKLARRAEELERAGYEITKLNIGNPGAFGFRMPETIDRKS